MANGRWAREGRERQGRPWEEGGRERERQGRQAGMLRSPPPAPGGIKSPGNSEGGESCKLRRLRNAPRLSSPKRWSCFPRLFRATLGEGWCSSYIVDVPRCTWEAGVSSIP